MHSITPSFGGRPKPSGAPASSPSKNSIKDSPALSKEPRWAVGVTTCDRPGEPTLPRTVDSLIASGWSDIELFCDGPIGSSMPKNFFSQGGHENVRVHDRPERQGAYANFVCALTEIVMARGPDVDLILMVQDDVVLAKNCRAYLEQTFRNPHLANLGTVWSLYCSGSDYDLFDRANDLEPGWKATNRGWGMQGALTVVFRLHEAVSFLASESTWLHRVIKAPSAKRQVDAEIGKWAKQNNKPAMFHHPSLAQHTGEQSSIYAIHDMKDRRSAVSFVGETYDALALLKEKQEIPRRRHGKRIESIGLYGPLGLSPEGFVTARLADIELTRSVLCLPQGGYPMRPVTFEAPIVVCNTGTNPIKLASAFKDCDAILTTIPMTSQAISWAKARDLDIVALVTKLPETKKKASDHPWYATLRAASLALTPWKEGIDILGQFGARNALGAIPEALGAHGETPQKGREGFFGDLDILKQRKPAEAIVFTNEASKLKGAFPQARIFDLTQEDHETFYETLTSLQWFFGGQPSGLHLPLIQRDESFRIQFIPDDEFSAFLTENIRRF